MVESSNGATFQPSMNTKKALTRKENVNGNDSLQSNCSASIRKGTKKKFKREPVVVPPLFLPKDSSAALTNHSRTLPPSSRVLISSSALESNSSLPFSNQSNSTVNIAFQLSKDNSNNDLLQSPSHNTSEFEIPHKFPANICLHQRMKRNKKCKIPKMFQESSYLVKPFRKHLTKKRTSFSNSWTKITNPDLLEAVVSRSKSLA